MPPVGIVSVLSQVAHRPGIHAYAIDENNYAGPTDYQGMPDHGFLQGRHPASLVLFYGGMSNAVPRLYSLAREYKRFGATTVAGGSHVDALPEEALAHGVDIVVHGEGEHAMIELLEALGDGGGPLPYDALTRISGISYLDADGSYRRTGKRMPVAQLDTLIDPDLTLIKHLRKRWSAIPVSWGRGCNFRCEFCVVNTQYGRHKSCSEEKFVEQVVRYADMGYRRFFIVDDNFAQDPQAAIRVSRMIGDYARRFRKKLIMTVQVRTDVAEDPELIAAMRYAGIDTLAIGYESPIDSELRAMRKGVDVATMVRRSRILARHFYIHGMFIFGYPRFAGDPEASLPLTERAKAYIRFFRKARIDTVQVLNAVPLPGSRLRARLECEGRILPQEMVGWDKYDGQFLCYDPTPEGLDPHELQELPRLLMKKRYLGSRFTSFVNYGNWMNWAYLATVGFPIEFSVFYTKRFIHGLRQRIKEHAIDARGNIFAASLRSALADIRRRWRNTAVKTYAGAIVRRWTAAYRKSGFSETLKKRFAPDGA